MADIFKDPARFQKEYQVARAEISKHFQYNDFFLQKNTFTGKEIQSPADFELFLHCLAVKQVAEKNAEAPTITIKPPPKERPWLPALTGLFAILLVVAVMAAPYLWQDARTKGYDSGYATARADLEKKDQEIEAIRQEKQEAVDELNENLLRLDQELAQYRGQSPPTSDPVILDEPPTEEELNAAASAVADPASVSLGDIESSVQAAVSISYVVNTESRIFHIPSCPYVPKIRRQSLKLWSGSRDEMIAEGFHPCQQCAP